MKTTFDPIPKPAREDTEIEVWVRKDISSFINELQTHGNVFVRARGMPDATVKARLIIPSQPRIPVKKIMYRALIENSRPDRFSVHELLHPTKEDAMKYHLGARGVIEVEVEILE